MGPGMEPRSQSKTGPAKPGDHRTREGDAAATPGPEVSKPGLVVARVAAAFALAAAVLAVLRPFLVPIVWAAIVAYVTWPLHRRMRAHTRRPRLAAALLTIAAALVAGLPVAWFLVALAREATQMVEGLRGWLAHGTPLPDWVTAQPWLEEAVGRVRAALLERVSLTEWLVRNGARLSSSLVDVASGIARNLIHVGLTFLTLYVLYVNGENTLAVSRRLARTLFPYAPARFLENIGVTVRAVVFGLIGTGLVQGLLSGAAFAIAGVPSPVALGALTALLSLVPAGPTLVGAGTVAWLVGNGQLGAAIALGAWVLLVVASVDNVLRPMLISGPTRVPFLLVFFGVLGGLASFGMLGVFVGPVLLSVAFTLLVEFGRARPEAEASGD